MTPRIPTPGEALRDVLQAAQQHRRDNRLRPDYAKSKSPRQPGGGPADTSHPLSRARRRRRFREYVRLGRLVWAQWNDANAAAMVAAGHR